MAEQSDGRRRRFGPVVLVGLASAGLAAVAGNRDWVGWSAAREKPSSLLTLSGNDVAAVPLAGALALVLLACWGVLLVTRARVRRVVAGLGLMVAVGMVVTAVLGQRSATDGLHAELAEVGVEDVTTHLVAWFWIYLAAALLSVAAAAAAVRLAPSWPEMSSRYDAPGAAPVRADPDDPDNSLDLWRAIDQGHDPTLPNDGHRDP
jgi:uncharacterized membrane protein (TIGR02234 family)